MSINIPDFIKRTLMNRGDTFHHWLSVEEPPTQEFLGSTREFSCWWFLDTEPMKKIIPPPQTSRCCGLLVRSFLCSPQTLRSANLEKS